MKRVIGLSALILVSSIANAACYGTGNFRTCYDEQSGNNYQIQRFGNTTQMYGSNPSTGSTWSQNTQRIGNTTFQNGFDSNGNSWSTTRQDYGNGNYTINGFDSNGNTVNKSCFGGICN